MVDVLQLHTTAIFLYLAHSLPGPAWAVVDGGMYANNTYNGYITQRFHIVDGFISVQ